MKLFGNKKKKNSSTRKSGAAPKNRGKKPEALDEEETRKRTPEEIEEINRQIARYQKHKLRKRLIILGVLVALVVAVIVFIKLTVKPPEIHQGGLVTNTPRVTNSAQPTGEEGSPLPSIKPESARKDGVYTFLVVGNDDGNGNTDTMMVGALDTVNKTLNIVNIPRDTLVNVPWWLHKANTFLSYDEGWEGVVKGVRDITGFTVDSYISVDLEAFKALVEALGGVYFDVPEDMYYVDPTQDLYINLSAGYQLLNPEQAMGVVRYRSYAAADIKRIEVQQKFLKAVAEQCLQMKNVLIIDDLAKIFKEYVDTDLSLGNIAWYMTELLKLDSENINFYTIPANYTDSINGISYPTIYLDEWLELNNRILNPYTTQITENHVNILTRDEYGDIYSTSGEVLNWNFGSSYSDDDGDDDYYDYPIITDSPVETDPPVTDEPSVTDEPAITDEPDVTDDPQTTDDSNTTDEPQSTEPAESTDSPADTPAENIDTGDGSGAENGGDAGDGTLESNP